jgi:cation diffusion facilitator CzcD-associated flavoprotein CzcO
MSTVDYILKEAVVVGAGISGLAVNLSLLNSFRK